LFWWNNLAVSAQTCVTGASLESRAGAIARRFEDLHLTARWLTAFHQETTTGRIPARTWFRERLVDGLCAEYAATFGLTCAEANLFDTLSRHLDSIGTRTVPIVWQHGDLCPPNVYRDRSDVAVIDWETARRGPALADLLSFVTYWAAAVAARHTKASRLDHFEMLFCAPAPATSLVRMVHAEVAEYTRRLEVSPSLFPFLLVYTFLEKALEEPRRRTRLTGLPDGDRRDSLEVGYVGVLAAHAGMLFDGLVSRG
jgi:aminoglycoside phosphotransferase (APT) family kinase protein